MFGYPLGGESASGAQRRAARPLATAGLLVGRNGDLLELEGYGNAGASGSPVVDPNGQVVGVIMGGRKDGDVELLYAVPVSDILAFLER